MLKVKTSNVSHVLEESSKDQQKRPPATIVLLDIYPQEELQCAKLARREKSRMPIRLPATNAKLDFINRRLDKLPV